MQYYLAEEARFRAIEIGSLAAALVVALLIGFLLTQYYVDMHSRMQQLYHTTICDDLTGLFNRRGAKDAISKSLARNTESYAMLLVDIDNLKMINDRYGHVAGDKVIARAAEAIRQSIRYGDDYARLGGDEFMIFASNCDSAGAAAIGRRILARLTSEAPIAEARFGVSVGIAVQERIRPLHFDRMYRDADAWP